MAEKNLLDDIAGIILIIAGIFWGIMIWDINLIHLIFRLKWLIDIVYAIVGLSSLYMIYSMFFKK